MASPTRCTWIWASSRRWWRTGKPVCWVAKSWTRLNEQQLQGSCDLRTLSGGYWVNPWVSLYPYVITVLKYPSFRPPGKFPETVISPKELIVSPTTEYLIWLCLLIPLKVSSRHHLQASQLLSILICSFMSHWLLPNILLFLFKKLCLHKYFLITYIFLNNT